ncbi:MAG: hypothetical protein LBJ64_12285 [Deltaproteobacteria bacterium]|jgi:hypothetical protein|nr:hypothetical protein [Deltaproteobacteria bacterium]
MRLCNHVRHRHHAACVILCACAIMSAFVIFHACAIISDFVILLSRLILAHRSNFSRLFRQK